MPTAMTALAKYTVGSGGTPNITFSSISNAYTDLLLLVSVRTESSGGQMRMRFNSSTDSSYNRVKLYGDNSTTAAGVETSQTYFNYIDVANSNYTSTTYTNVRIYIPNYAGSLRKVFSVDSGDPNRAGAGYTEMHAGIRTNTSAITDIELSMNNSTDFEQYTTAYLYGIKNS